MFEQTTARQTQSIGSDKRDFPRLFAQVKIWFADDPSVAIDVMAG
jgi:hypothetical protein